MPRSRVLSFMSQWGAPPRSPTSGSNTQDSSSSTPRPARKLTVDTSASSFTAQALSPSVKDSPSPTTQQRFRSDSRAEARTPRPLSMIQTYQPAMMDVHQDTLPELQPIFTFLNSHSNKLYQEGYFLKLHDLDSRGRPSADRVWNECFAQLVGTVLSLWDAAALDAAGEDGEVVPTFVNLSDASIKMIESLPMNGSAGGTLQNVLSISTAANNRYLLHFNSLNSLTQWTAGIRLAIYEHATLQEAYTGSLIAGKGRMLNNIRTIMDRSKFKNEDWARVRFGAGTPWRRCWCVINPPDEKEYIRAQKTLKKRDTYNRTVVVPKGDIKFYDTRKITKKTRPLATITDAYAAYAIYPQSKPLIDQSTLVKIEGSITIHAKPETTTEGFVFVMPEVHPAVTGFEMMLRFLFPVFDTFALYGRPTRLIADTLDQRGLMFAMPRDRRYGYLDILDVSGLIHTEGSQNWSERQWRMELKKLTSHRMNSVDFRGSPRRSRTNRASLNISRGAVRFSEDGSSSSPTTRKSSPVSGDESIQFGPPRRTETAPVHTGSPIRGHNRSASEAVGYKRYQTETPSRLSYEAHAAEDDYNDQPPPPPLHGGVLRTPSSLERIASEPEPYEGAPPAQAFEELKLQSSTPQLVPVSSPPRFEHTPNSKPARVPLPPPAELQRANSAMDAATLHQLADATAKEPEYEQDPSDLREVASAAKYRQRLPADASVRNEEMVDRYTGATDRQPRLTTIPGSPFVNDSFPRSNDEDRAPPVPLHRNQSDYSTTSDGRPVSKRSINRKPVPVSTSAPMKASTPAEPPTPSSNASLRGEILDHARLERLLMASPNDSASSYDANESVDYASTEAPSPKKPAEKEWVRTGRLKTVGNPDLAETDTSSRFDPLITDQPEKEKGEYPSIDFGPTLTYKPTARPTTGVTTPGSIPLEGDGPEQETGARSSSRLSMLDNRRNSYFDSRKEENRRSVAWQPTATTPGEVPEDHSLTPEQWVQHRAALASQPTGQPRPSPFYSQGRQHSSTNVLRSTSKTPPLGRTTSGDWGRQLRRTSKTPPLTRTHSGDWTQQAPNQPPSRPQSRTAGAVLNPPSPGKTLVSMQAPSLSAREQMHVAQATGSPMLNLTGKDKKQSEDSQAPGLIGAMAARERERVAIKDGMRSNVVQQEIVRRQQQQQQQAQVEMEAQMQAQFQAQQVAQQQAQAYQYHVQQQQHQQQVNQMYAGSRPTSQYMGQMPQAAVGGSSRPTSLYMPQMQQAAAGGNSRPTSLYMPQMQQAAAGGNSRPTSLYMPQMQQAAVGGASRPTSQYMGQMPQAAVNGGQGWSYGGAPQQQQQDPRQQQWRY